MGICLKLLIGTILCAIHIAPNITDVWPEKGRQSMLGAEQYTLDQEEGRTEGREVFIWERQAYGDGDRDLGEPQSQEELTDEVHNQLAHALDSCLGVSASPEFKSAFDSNSTLGIRITLS